MRPFTEVRAGESGVVLLLGLNVFLILMAYYFIRPVEQALILEGVGAEFRAYLSLPLLLLLLGAVPLYGALVNRMPRRRLINVVTAFFAACLVAFYVIFQIGVPLWVQGIVFFLWVGVFARVVVAQFWSFAYEIYKTEQGERLFPIVAFGASFGAVFGGFISGGVIELAGLYLPMLLAGGLLVVSLLITNYVDARSREEQGDDLAESQGESQADVEIGGDETPYRVVLRSSYLLMIALLALCLTLVDTNGEYILGKLVESAAAEAVMMGQAEGLSEGELIGRFYSRFDLVVSTLSLFIQLFLVSRAIKYFGVRGSLVVLPLLALGVNTLIVLFPLMAAVRWAKTAEAATDYSLQNTVENILFLPCTREQKYKAKQAIHTFFVRAGAVMAAVVVYVGTTFLAFGPRGFAALNVVLVLIALALAVGIGLKYRRFVDTGQTP